MENLQNQSGSQPEFSLGIRSDPDYTQDQFFASIEQHLDIVTPPSGTYSQLKEPAKHSRRRHSIKNVCSIEERHERALEKNRAAQKRFRNKQKDKVNQMEQQVEELNQKVQQLEIEKQQLQVQLQQSKDSSSSDSHYTEAIDQAADTEQVKKFEGTYYMKSIDRQITSEMIRNLHNPQVRAHVVETFQLMIAEINQRVKEVDVPFPEKQKMQKLEEVIEDERACMVRMFVINPAGAQNLSCDFKPHSVQELENEQELESQVNLAIEKMQLSETQKSLIHFLWQRYCLLQIDCMNQRTEIATQLTDADARNTTQLSYYKQFTKTHQLVFRVRENWRQDYKNHWDLMSTIALQILTPLQFGKMMYYMAPNTMDFFILCRVISKQLETSKKNNNISGSTSKQTEQFNNLQNTSENDLQNSSFGNLFIFGQQQNLDVQDFLTSSVDLCPMDSVSEIKDFEEFDSATSQKIAPNSPDSFQKNVKSFQL